MIYLATYQKVDEILNHTKLLEYPKNSDKGRGSFKPDWFNKFKWLEYSKNRDAVLQLFQSVWSLTKENAFSSRGSWKWKQELSKGMVICYRYSIDENEKVISKSV